MKLGSPEISLVVSDIGASPAFYESLGFKRVEVEDDLLPARVESEALMTISSPTLRSERAVGRQ